MGIFVDKIKRSENKLGWQTKYFTKIKLKILVLIKETYYL
jgi:hypothetical protein